MKSRWLPTMPIHAANWLADPRIQMLPPQDRCALLESLLRSWMLGKAIVVPASIAESYAELWPEYDEVRGEHHRNYERRAAQTAAARAARHSPDFSVTEPVTEPVTSPVTERTPTPTPTPTPTEASSPTPAVDSLRSSPGAGSETFEVFWEHYPRKTDKQEAFGLWRKIALDRVPEVMSGLLRWVASPEWKDGFAPSPARFLRREKWLDEPPPERARSATNRTAAEKTMDNVRKFLKESA